MIDEYVKGGLNEVKNDVARLAEAYANGELGTYKSEEETGLSFFGDGVSHYSPDSLGYFSDYRPYRNDYLMAAFLYQLEQETGLTVVAGGRERCTQNVEDYYILVDANKTELWLDVPEQLFVFTGDDCGCCGGNNIDIIPMTIEKAKEVNHNIMKEYLSYIGVIEDDD